MPNLFCTLPFSQPRPRARPSRPSWNTAALNGTNENNALLLANNNYYGTSDTSTRSMHCDVAARALTIYCNLIGHKLSRAELKTCDADVCIEPGVR